MNKDGRKIRFGLWYDFRNPPQWRQASDRLYSEILDQVAWGENNGFDDVWLSEHHFIEDGYLPSILPVAAAIAARTKRIRIVSGVLLVPFHNPVRLAEDIATVDVISGGRFELGAGVGFKREEFEGFGVPFKERGARTNQSLEIIRRALAGETVTFKSEFFDFQNIKVTPEPIQKPHPPIWLGGFTPAALRRAARFGDGFTVPGANRDVYDRYVAELQKENRPTDDIRFASGTWCLIVGYDQTPGAAGEADVIRGPVLLLQLGDIAIVDIPVRPRHGETIAKAGGAAQCRRREAAQPNRRMRLLDRLWRYLDVLEVEELALEGDGLSGKRAPNYFEGLVGSRPALLERHTKTFELFPLEADAGAELETTAGDHIDCRNILGKAYGIVKRHQEHSGYDADPLGAGSDRRGYGQNRGKIPIFDEVVLRQPDIIKPVVLA